MAYSYVVEARFLRSNVLSNQRNGSNQPIATAHSLSKLICLFFFFLTVYTYIQSRFYRSPEVILGKWKFSFLDLFNLCALATFHTTLLSCFQVRTWCNPFSILVETNDTKLVPIICRVLLYRGKPVFCRQYCWYFLAKPPNYTRAKQKQARKLLLDKQI